MDGVHAGIVCVKERRAKEKGVREEKRREDDDTENARTYSEVNNTQDGVRKWKR